MSLSVSGATRFLQCPWRYTMDRSGADKPETVRPQRMRVGSAVHAALEAAFLGRLIETEPDPDDKMLRYRPAAERALQIAWDDEALPRTYGLFDEALGAVLATLGALPAPHPSHVLAVERRIEGRTPEGTEIVGILDLALQVDPVTVRVVDWKYRARPRERTEILLDLQLNTYDGLIRQAHPQITTVIHGQYYPPVQSGVFVTAHQDWIDAAMEQLDAVAEMIETTEPTPCPGDYCGECPWQAAHCPAWKDGVRVAA